MEQVPPPVFAQFPDAPEVDTADHVIELLKARSAETDALH